MAFRGNMKRRMAKANECGAAFAIIVGDDELARGRAAVKNLASGEQAEAVIEGLAQRMVLLTMNRWVSDNASLEQILSADRIGFISEPGQAKE